MGQRGLDQHQIHRLNPGNDDAKQVGSIIDFEKVGHRSPAGVRPSPWMVNDTFGSTWGYTTGRRVSNAGTILGRLIDTVSKDGLSAQPRSRDHRTIPEGQLTTLHDIGARLNLNLEAIPGTHAWTSFAEGEWRFTVEAGEP